GRGRHARQVADGLLLELPTLAPGLPDEDRGPPSPVGDFLHVAGRAAPIYRLCAHIKCRSEKNIYYACNENPVTCHAIALKRRSVSKACGETGPIYSSEVPSNKG
ncbi:MAG: hypothetical protein OXT74_06480, partial [Candidatus Poribacteria bacterium]|nr:hypothetical protein [Candidatus Poribacteria bacterium]